MLSTFFILFLILFWFSLAHFIFYVSSISPFPQDLFACLFLSLTLENFLEDLETFVAPFIFKNVCVCVCVWCVAQYVQLFATPWTVALQIPLSMGFSRQEYQNGLSFPYWGDLPNRGIEPRSPSLHQVWATREAHIFKNDALKSWLSHWMCINRAYHLWAFTVWQSSDVMNPR